MHWQFAGECEQVAVARNEHRVLVGGEGQQVVVSRIDTAHRRRMVGIVRHRGGATQPGDERVGIVRGYEASQLRISECSLELGEEERRDDQLEVTLLPGQQRAGRGPASRAVRSRLLRMSSL